MLARRGTLAEAGVHRVSEQLLLHKASTTEQPRPHRTNRHAKNLSGRFVRLVLYIHNNQRGAEWFRNVVQRLTDRRPQVEPCEHFVEAIPDRHRVERSDGRGIDLGGVQLDRGSRSLARPQKHVAADGEQPPAAVTPGHVRVPGSKGPQESVLYYVVRIGLVARQREGEAIDIIDPRDGFAFERRVALSQCTVCRWHVS